ncbi:alpha/beta hydrolase [Putridiphycobacter roseus]|uniref:Alpha/beta hydrolase n=1 Tax=Putridiphycobacter roseus TaxID=2219161 RepID=A0A2W1N327_9FLAO|nr:alpha/beta hydrolase [Putridiphycobacter roseus]PZE17960.1 alpha/beta hydrolase [Putridiphycobacter roseus]
MIPLTATYYSADILGDGFESLIMPQKSDYEGSVVSTLIRRKALPSNKAILYIHGLNDYFFQTEMAKSFNDKGYHFYAIDLRKYGRSYLPHQKLNNVRELKEYDADLNAAFAQMKSEGIQQVLLTGHSTGGLIVMDYLSRNKNHPLVKQVFLNSPFFDFNESYLIRKVGIPLLSKIGKHFPDIKISGGFSKLYGQSLHHNDHGEWQYNKTWKPDRAPKVNLGFIHAIHQAQVPIQQGTTLNIPALIMHSKQSVHCKKWSDKMFEGDAILNVKHIQKNALKIKGEIQIISVENALHDLVLSPKNVRKNVYFQLFNWLKQTVNK